MSCSTASLICIPHFLHDADLLHKQPGAFSGKTGPCAGDRQVLTWRTPGDNIHRGQFISFELCDVPDMEHTGEPFFGHLYGECFDLTGPYRLNAVVQTGKREASDPIKEAAKRGSYLFLNVDLCILPVDWFSSKV